MPSESVDVPESKDELQPNTYFVFPRDEKPGWMDEFNSSNICYDQWRGRWNIWKIKDGLYIQVSYDSFYHPKPHRCWVYVLDQDAYNAVIGSDLRDEKMHDKYAYDDYDHYSSDDGDDY